MSEDVNRFALPTGEKIDRPKMGDLDRAIYAAAQAGTIVALLISSGRWVDLTQWTRDAEMTERGSRRIRKYRGYRVIVDDELDGRSFEIVGLFAGSFDT